MEPCRFCSKKASNRCKNCQQFICDKCYVVENDFVYCHHHCLEEKKRNK